MSTALANHQAANIVASVLVEGGVRHVVLSPGARNTPLVLAFDAHPLLQCHTILDERSAAFVALGLARESGRAVALNCTSGTAAAHYFPAIIEASESQVPLIILTADRPPELQGVGAPQTIDQRNLYGRHVRFFEELEAPHPAQKIENYRATIENAVSVALTIPRGPVHLNHPFREPLWEEDALYAPAQAQEQKTREEAPVPSPERLNALSTTLQAHNKGVIVCGPRCPTPGEDPFPEAVVALAERLNWPILAEPTSGVRYGRHNRHNVMSSYDALLRCEAFAAGFTPDYIVQFGGTLASKACRKWVENTGHKTTLLIDPGVRWSKEGEQKPLRVDADPTELCRALLNLLPATSGKNWVEGWQQADAIATEQALAACASGVWEGAIARTLIDKLSAPAILHVASSMPIRDLDTFTATHGRPLRVHANRGANGIDGIISTALGENLANRELPVVALMGDLSFLHDTSGLLTAGALAPNLTLVVIDNGGGGIFEFLPISKLDHGFEPLFIAPQKAHISKLVEAADGRWCAADSMATFAAAIDTEIDAPGLSVIEVPVDRAENVRRHADLWDLTSEILEQWLESKGEHLS